MSYKCFACGINDVEHQGDICDLCAIGQDPYAANTTTNGTVQSTSQQDLQNNNTYSPKRSANRKVLLGGGNSVTNTDPYGNDMTPIEPQPSVQVYSAGQVPQMITQQNNPTMVSSATSSNYSKQPITAGITKNIQIDDQKKSIIVKWVRALFTGIPFTIDNDVTMFQVFPDFSGTSLNALGNSCDQVIVYGKLNNGAISENNDVEVYGHRDSNNNIIAKTIKNKASGTTIIPTRSITQGIVWLITVVVFALIAMAVFSLGVEGIIWAAVIILCLTNLPKVLKILGVIIGGLFSFLKRLF